MKADIDWLLVMLKNIQRSEKRLAALRYVSGFGLGFVVGAIVAVVLKS